MTLVSHSKRFIFLKTHKTAGTSVEVALEPLCLPAGAESGAHYRGESVTETGIVGARGKAAEGATWRNHMSARRVRSQLPRDQWRGYLKFTVVRNPYDRLVSMFHGRQSPEARARLAEAPFDEVRAAFREFIATRGVSNNLNKLCIGPFYRLEHVLYYEQLTDDFARLCAHFGHEAALPRFKADRRRRTERYDAYYDDATRRAVEKASAFELAFFGYDFEGGPNPGGAMARAGRIARAAPWYLASAPIPPSRAAI